MTIVQIKPDIIRKGLSLYTIPSKMGDTTLSRISINDETVKEYSVSELYLGNVKIVLAGHSKEIDCTYSN